MNGDGISDEPGGESGEIGEIGGKMVGSGGEIGEIGEAGRGIGEIGGVIGETREIGVYIGEIDDTFGCDRPARRIAPSSASGETSISTLWCLCLRRLCGTTSPAGVGRSGAAVSAAACRYHAPPEAAGCGCGACGGAAAAAAAKEEKEEADARALDGAACPRRAGAREVAL